LFTCMELLDTAQALALALGTGSDKIFLLDTPESSLQLSNGASTPVSATQMILDGKSLPALEEVQLQEGEGCHRIAYLIPTSGTSGVVVGTQI
jgi:hypothetical protein